LIFATLLVDLVCFENNKGGGGLPLGWGSD
jgi:hypothetical protein